MAKDREARSHAAPAVGVRAELEQVLAADQTRLGEVYRGLQRGLTADEIAAELRVATSNFVFNYRAIADSFLTGTVPSSPHIAAQAAGRCRSILKRGQLSPDAHDYLEELEERLRRKASTIRRPSGETPEPDEARPGPLTPLTQPDVVAVEDAAAQVLHAGLVQGDSAFAPGRPVWTSEHLAELQRAFVDQPDVSGSSFEAKLVKQLEPVSDGAVQLFAEIFYLNLLPLADYRGATKRRLLERVLSMSSTPVTVPADLADALDGGVFNGGVAFKTRRFQQLSLLIAFAAHFRSLDPARQQSAFTEPERFASELAAVTEHREPAQRYALQYLAWPSYYLPIVNGDHRRAIRTAFADRIGGASADIDADLRQIYDALSLEQGGPVDLYDEPWHSMWDPKARRSSAWDEFMAWAARFARDVDLDREERTYKLETAERLATALRQLGAGDDAWVTSLRTALNVNLVDTFFRMALFNDLRDHSDEVGAAILGLMGPGPRGNALDAFHQDLKAISGRNTYTTGNATSLGSLLLMATDVAEYPPYRPTPVTKALELTGQQPPAAAPSARFEALVNLCDEVLERAGDVGIELRDRLDAQGLIWTTVSHEALAEWSDEERAALDAWRGGKPQSETPAVRGAWLVRNRDGVESWRRDGVVAFDAGAVRELEPGSTVDELRTVVDEDLASLPYTARARRVDVLHTLLDRMHPGDLVVTLVDRAVLVGTITGEATSRRQGFGTLVERPAQWAVQRDASRVSSALAATLQSPDDVVDLTAHLAELDALLTAQTEIPATPALRLVPPDEALARELHIDLSWLQECTEVLAEKKQLVFYGPPGTGKTFLAKRLATHVAGDRSRVRLVQFHPAYSYEDFFEGYRPTPDGGFSLQAGPFRKIVDQARQDPGTAYFLVIDEINRGNLAKVFGELYFLLEYRDEQIDLLYGTDDGPGFTLPGNVFLIGTMNTADRSIALVDTAMRRRFAFIELHPSSEPVSGLLRRWLRANDHHDEAAALLDVLNARIGDPEAAVGPAYFMKPGGQTSEGIARVWRTAILPLLEERHYGDGTDVHQRYALAEIRAEVRRASAGPLDDEHDDDLGAPVAD